MQTKTPRPTDAELEILTILWSRGPATVREIHELIELRKPTQYTTVLKTLQIMAEKALVTRDEKSRSHIYTAAASPESTRQQLAGDLLQRGFGGSPALLLQGALSSRRATKEDLEAIRLLLDQYEAGAK